MSITQQARKVDLRDYLRVVLRRIWLVIIPVVVAMATAFTLTTERFQRPVYQSKARLEVELQQPLSGRNLPAATGLSMGYRALWGFL